MSNQSLGSIVLQWLTDLVNPVAVHAPSDTDSTADLYDVIEGRVGRILSLDIHRRSAEPTRDSTERHRPT